VTAIWLWLLCLGGVVYAGFLFRALAGIWKLDKSRMLAIPFGSTKPLSVSIIIAARNEEDWIGATLDSLLQQDISTGEHHFEIIVVDDRSSDRTAEIVQNYSDLHPQIRHFRQSFVPPGVSPKKAALALGVSVSSGRIIVTTDADCRHHPGWARALAKGIPSEGGMVIGQARFMVRKHDPLWLRLQALDFAAQGVLSAGLAAAGTPFNCSGASLAFSRDAYQKVQGWQGVLHFISGDDELLMQKFHAAGIPVVVAWGKESVVATRSPGSLGELWHQRSRWGSKTLHYPAKQKAVLTGVFLFYLALALAPFVMLSGFGWFPAIIGMAAKMLLDLSLLNASKPLFADEVSNFEFVLAELLHPPLIVILAISGALGFFEWKGTTYKTKGRA